MIRHGCPNGARGGGVALAVDVVLLMLMALYDPSNHPLQEIIADFPAIAEIHFFETFGAVGHFQDGLRGDVPNGLHTPSLDIGAAGSCQGREPFVADVETVRDVDHDGSRSYEGADVVDEDVIGY